MQDWRQQAEKNNLVVLSRGPCQLCGAPTTGGISECVEISAGVAHKLAHEAGLKTMCIFLCVDAHALSHAQIHGRWNNHFHLARLHLILISGIQWKYSYSSALSGVVDRYKADHPDERIAVPDFSKKSCMTAFDIKDIEDDEVYVASVWQWAREVHSSFWGGHEIAEILGRKFCDEFIRD